MVSEHLTEDRADLEQRFLLMGQFVMHARKLTAMCELAAEDCPSCIALREALPIPHTVLAAQQEPREDLEEACVSINDRLVTVAEMPDNGCPGRAFVYRLLTDATEAA